MTVGVFCLLVKRAKTALSRQVGIFSKVDLGTAKLSGFYPLYDLDDTVIIRGRDAKGPPLAANDPAYRVDLSLPAAAKILKDTGYCVCNGVERLMHTCLPVRDLLG